MDSAGWKRLIVFHCLASLQAFIKGLWITNDHILFPGWNNPALLENAAGGTSALEGVRAPQQLNMHCIPFEDPQLEKSLARETF